MSDSARTVGRRPVVLGPGEGRAYPMGPLSAVFKADEFYVLAGTMSVMVDTDWIEATAGSFVMVPGNVPHDFENRTSERAGMLNVSAPGEFERNMARHRPVVHRRPEADSRA